MAYTTPNGQRVLVVLNAGQAQQSFRIACNGQAVSTSLPAGRRGHLRMVAPGALAKPHRLSCGTASGRLSHVPGGKLP